MELEVVKRGRFDRDDKLAGPGTPRPLANACEHVQTRANACVRLITIRPEIIAAPTPFPEPFEANVETAFGMHRAA